MEGLALSMVNGHQGHPCKVINFHTCKSCKVGVYSNSGEKLLNGEMNAWTKSEKVPT